MHCGLLIKSNQSTILQKWSTNREWLPQQKTQNLEIWAKEEFDFSVWAKFEPRMGHMEGIVAKSKCKSEEGEILT